VAFAQNRMLQIGLSAWDRSIGVPGLCFVYIAIRGMLSWIILLLALALSGLTNYNKPYCRNNQQISVSQR
jgi:hypothetical protein